MGNQNAREITIIQLSILNAKIECFGDTLISTIWKFKMQISEGKQERKFTKIEYLETTGFGKLSKTIQGLEES